MSKLHQHVRVLPVVTWGLLMTAACVVQGADSSAQTAAELDRLLRSRVPESAQPVGVTDDATFLRRAFLDLVGETPTPDDVLAFSLDDSPGKRQRLIESLLADEAFGQNWARYWRDVILYRRTEERALFTREPLVRYLADQFNNNEPWSKIATSFMTAVGDVRENGETALIMAQAGNPEDVTAEVSRIFLGIQIQCAQCHDHPTDSWKREQFHQLAAFFPRIAIRPDRSAEQQTFHVVVNDQPFQFQRRNNNNNRFRGTPEHHMPDLADPSAKGTLMQPVFFVTGSKLATGTRDADRRGTLAEWITAPTNPWFAKAYVNRIWSELVGEGFYEPIDDLGPDRECSSPETLERLAQAFTASGYDVKWLYRTIMATDAYQRKSLSRRDYDEVPFLANCPQRLRGDQLYDSLVSALDLETRVPLRARGQGGQGPYGRGGDPRTLFNLSFGFDPSDPRDEVGGSIQQALAIMNAPFINQAISARRPDGLGAMLRANPNDKDALVELYLKVLARGPNTKEQATCLAYIRQAGDRDEAFEDITWSLINSTEFIHRN